MKELYYETFTLCGDLCYRTDIKCNGEDVNVNDIKFIKITYPNKQEEYYLDTFECYDKNIGDCTGMIHETGFIFYIDYKGLDLKVDSHYLFENGCKLYAK